MPSPLPIVLASASPRRRQLIASLNLPYTVAVAPGDEDNAQKGYHGPIDDFAQWTASYKALMMLTLPDIANRVIITADTTVLLDEQVLNKPRDEAHARELLLALRGRWHHVVTAVVVTAQVGKTLRMYGKSVKTPVLMRAYSEEEIDAYIASGDPMDKAGAYGIQSPQFQPTERIDGCYLSVVGLPLCALVELLANFDITPDAAAHVATDQTHQCPWSAQCRISNLSLEQS
jgi:septum formation protein